MDKYTVDLDKVLNDFEYSELTDQYNIGTAAHLNPVNSSISQRHSDLYKYNSAPSKHTINNVFQSLNEYLNTDIGQSEPTAVNDEHVEEAEREVVDDDVEVVQEEVSDNIVVEEEVPDKTLSEQVQFSEDQKTEEIPEPETVGFTDDIAIDESELNQYLDDLESEADIPIILESGDAPEIIITNSESSVHTVDSSENEDNTLSRPSTLEISNSSQIDLVGEPGSTPYNNMYVTETLSVEKVVPESEGDSSPSPSPTFSEVSTESNGSTATTESVTDSVTDKEVTPFDRLTVEEQPLNENDDKVEEADTDVATEAQSVESGFNETEISEHSTELETSLGKQAPLWIPDSDADNCLHCDTKFTVIKRRHHCRACGLVLCSKCCNKKHKLDYLDSEARVCLRCYDILSKDTQCSSSEASPESGNSPNRQCIPPNPNNPMEYCSKSRTNKSVMFCDGIRPGSELTDLDNDFNYHDSKKLITGKKCVEAVPKENKNGIVIDAVTKSFIPGAENDLPPVVKIYKSDVSYSFCENNATIVDLLKNEEMAFAIHSNLYIHVKIINMSCCINKWAWCFTSQGMITVGQDEIVLLLEFIDNEKTIPKDMFLHFNSIYLDAKRGTSITEHGMSLHETNNFLESKNHIGFLYIRPSFQCLQNVIIPKEPYLIGILIHRWEVPWAKIFPLRLILRLGAEYRYYPSPIISTRHRESVFVEIGHTIINLLADFRNFSYTLPNIRGLTIHMEEKNTTVTIPLNRYDQVLKTLNNSSDHILAFGGNFSVKADSHLVCIQDTQGNNENTYTTHAININNRPRKVTGASFIVFNGALKSSSGLTAKSSIVEDGLMIQIPPEHMVQIRESLRNMKDHTIQCGCINAVSDETINIVWGDNDVNFNTGVLSAIDNQPLNGIPSIRVHNGKDFICNSGNKLIRWTEVFIMQMDFSKLAENISKATCQALVKYLDLLASNNFDKIGIRTNLHVENVSYSAGSNGMKLPPIYMKSLDNELIPVLHRITSNNLGDLAIVLELVFRILNV
ncbi:hypothetical protein RN001_010637 [Aquatica leii]|uniref:FYVE-type domain-containing protein n=1 Tax=Aquatica leii TaxID=1421715 RepID=A0AAN7S8N1_9COLE|nr:hypothetical protein RN001_010637 [Aquatica leii]